MHCGTSFKDCIGNEDLASNVILCARIEVCKDL